MDTCAVWWIKRDIRLGDNIALDAALKTGLPVVPVFIFEPSVLHAPECSAMHAHAQLSALTFLKKKIQERGSECLVYSCDAERAFIQLNQVFQVSQVFSQEETGVETTFGRDRRLAAWFTERQITWTEVSQGGVIRRCRNRTRQETMRKEYYSATPLATPSLLPPLPISLLKDARKPLPTLKELGFPSGSHLLQRTTEQDAVQILQGFLKGRGEGYRYKISSPSTAFESGSRLSAHLAWGTISARQIFQTVSSTARLLHPDSNRAKDLRAFRARIHWRDHFMQRLESAPWMEFRSLNPLFTRLPYREDPQQFLESWLAGTTGFPMIDASMRCLSRTGFLNFRMRAMVTSFATHALRIDWKTINAPLAALMYDYEPGIHISQIQMQAGVTGINTLRVYSPAKQLADQDPDLVFVRKWLPELANIADITIFEAGNKLIPGYIPPIVDFDAEIKIMKDALYEIKKSAENRVHSAEIVAKYGSRLRRSGPRKLSSLKLTSVKSA